MCRHLKRSFFIDLKKLFDAKTINGPASYSQRELLKLAFCSSATHALKNDN
jgi:hypothetical protein